jgi:hypothetical protein
MLEWVEELCWEQCLPGFLGLLTIMVWDEQWSGTMWPVTRHGVLKLSMVCMAKIRCTVLMPNLVSDLIWLHQALRLINVVDPNKCWRSYLLNPPYLSEQTHFALRVSMTFPTSLSTCTESSITFMVGSTRALISATGLLSKCDHTYPNRVQPAYSLLPRQIRSGLAWSWAYPGLGNDNYLFAYSFLFSLSLEPPLH